MRQVEQVMGLPITVDIPNCNDRSVFEAVFTRFHEIDERFSTYKPDSEVSHFKNGHLSKSKLSPELNEVIKGCKRAQRMTDGYFSAWAAAPVSHLDAVQGSQEEQASRIQHTMSAATDAADEAMRQKPASAAGSAGRQGEAVRNRWFDPSGYVKGWAIAEAGEIIEKYGFKTYCIGAGGDILAQSDSEKVWQIGIQDPTHPGKLLDLNKLAPHQNLSGAVGNRIAEHQVFGAGLSISNGAVASSGNYERGAHIINPKTKKPAAELLSVTVTGPGIIKADILATACFAMGHKAAEFMKSQKDYQAIIIAKG